MIYDIFKYIYLLVLCFIIESTNAQNLIPNPGFDIITDCPINSGQIYLASPWVSSANTPDLYNRCSTNPNLKVPNSGVYNDSYQQPLSGNGYAGIGIYADLNSPFKELISTPLTNTLLARKTYYVRFYVSPDLSPSSYWRYTDAVALAFTDSLVNVEIEPGPEFRVPLTAAIENLGATIKDTSGWTKVSGCYKANGTEKFATIGNFRPNSEVIFELEIDISGSSIFFYIEDVLVMKFDPLPDTILMCEDEEINLDAQFLDARYNWNTGDTTSVISVVDEGIYIVEAILDNCVLVDTTFVIGNNIPDSERDTVICNDDFIELSQSVYGDVIWSTGENTSSITVNESGIYSSTVTNKCGEFIFSKDIEAIACECNIYASNIFSPNGDNVNDEFIINISCDYEYEVNKFFVFDRWGNEVYCEYDLSNISWDGLSYGNDLSTGVYVWVLEYSIYKKGEKIDFVYSGDITIVT